MVNLSARAQCASVRRRGVPYYWKCKIKHGSPLCERFFLEIIVFRVEGGLCNLWKNSQKGSFRGVITSGDVENCFGVGISKSYESTADVCERCRRAPRPINGQDRHSTTLAFNLA